MSRPEPRPRVGERFVPEIAGLRTIALLLVATFHIWFGRVSGGVDIFLFVGAYLMTRSLAGRADLREFTKPFTFILRKLARLLPAAIAAIILTIVAVLLLTAPRTWGTLFEQALASGTYWMNIWLQNEAVDYWAGNRHDQSFFQHFWSLSLQGQVFIIWPFVHLAGEGIARLTRIRPRIVLLVIFSAISVLSMGHALISTAENAQLAYFDLFARTWEFSTGSALALIAPYLSFPRVVRRIMTAIGLVGVVACGIVMPIGAPYPGWPALWPIACAILIVAAADAPRAPTDRPDPALGHPVLQTIGGYTYALYLTHWPVLILYASLTGVDVPDPLTGLLLLAISGAAAYLITTLVERPVTSWMRGERMFARRFSPRLGLRTVAVVFIGALAATVIPITGTSQVEALKADDADEIWSVDVSVRGPQAGANDAFDHLVPADSVVENLAMAPGEQCPTEDWGTPICTESGPADAERSVVMIGSSHIMSYSGMIYETSQQQEEPWYLRAYGSPGCIFPGPQDEPNGCTEIWTTGVDYVLETSPDVLIVMGTVTHDDNPDWVHDGSGLDDLRPFIDEIQQKTDTEVIVIRDVPRFPFVPYECGARSGFDAPECTTVPQPAPSNLQPFADSVESMGATWVDLNSTICPDDLCTPTMGGLVTYHDGHHITGVLSRSLAQAFADQVHPKISWWPEQVWANA